MARSITYQQLNGDVHALSKLSSEAVKLVEGETPEACESMAKEFQSLAKELNSYAFYLRTSATTPEAAPLSRWQAN
jgi:hypothetical protein